MFDSASFAYHQGEKRRIIEVALSGKSIAELKAITGSICKTIFTPNVVLVARRMLSRIVWPYNQY